MKEVASPEDMNVDIVKMAATLGTSVSIGTSDLRYVVVPNAPLTVAEPGQAALPELISEGRVHGGSLMAILSGGSSVASSSNQVVAGESADLRNSNIMPQSWM